MPEPAQRIYWDACAWIGFFNNEADKMHPLRAIWEDARKGKYEIWSSTYVYLEVFKLKANSGDPIPDNISDEKIETALTQPYVKLAQVDAPVAKLARDLRREFDDEGLKSRPDAIHLATAAFWNIEELHTWDKKHLLDLSGRLNCRNGTPLKVRKPGPEVMGPLFAGLGQSVEEHISTELAVGEDDGESSGGP